MYDFVPRMDSISADVTASVRVVPAVTAVQPAATTSGSSSGTDVETGSDDSARRQKMASAADYADVHAEITRILAEMHRSSHSVQTQQAAGEQMDALLPQGIVIVPLPPATTTAMEQAVRVARNMVRQAELARSVYSNVSPSTVSQVMTASA